ncbi:hypothetical protein SAMN06265784_10580 [Paraburkholderia susongensis]|uniref:Uncharacterized protein n=1 Tax=Paraburkholderia susongensis TaxID=1515439 RepID=A0A1X7L6L3_9BURK|nr:hypothetical protein SAMN06265784_10580 [Paraburkholderia susongensis]
MFRARRHKAAARRFFEKAIGQNGSPEMVTIDKSGSSLAALNVVNAVNAEREMPVTVCQDCARGIPGGIELMHTIRKGQLKGSGKAALSVAQQFSSPFS